MTRKANPSRDTAEFERRTQQVRRVIYERGPIDGKALAKATPSVPAAERIRILQWLVDQDEIDAEIKPTRGRSKRIYSRKWQQAPPRPATTPQARRPAQESSLDQAGWNRIMERMRAEQQQPKANDSAAELAAT